MLLLRRHQVKILFKQVLCAGSSGPITEKTTNLITVLLLPVAILMIAYALCTFYMRSVYLQRKQVGPCEFPLVLLRHAEDKNELHVFLMVAAWSKCHIYPQLSVHVKFCDFLQMGFYLDWIGPTVLCALVMTVLTTIMVVAFVEIFSYH